MLRKLRKRKAFTLAELVFEVAVLAALVIPTVFVLGNLSLNVIETETNSIATDLCTQLMEEILLFYDFDTVTPSSGNFASPYQDYSYSVIVEYVDADDLTSVVGLSDYKRITISVSHLNIPGVVMYLLYVNV